MKTLIIDATGRTKDKSNTKYLATKVIPKLELGDYKIIDLYSSDIPFATMEMYNEIKNHDENSYANKFVDQFEAADQLVFIYPTWNWSVPAVLKAYIDLVCVSSRTFGYDQNGTRVGYLKNKKAVLISTTGGSTYEPISAAIKAEQSGDNYMEQILDVLGITNIQKFSVSNMAYDFNDDDGNFNSKLYCEYVDRYVATKL